MRKILGISMAVLVAVSVIAVGVTGFACGNKAASSSQTVYSINRSGQAGCPVSGGCGMSQCPYLRQMHEQAASNRQMTCGSAVPGYYNANVYHVTDGHAYAVCDGQLFEVTPSTFVATLGNARYFFCDACSVKAFEADPAQSAAELDQEAVSLATVDGNVVSQAHGQLVAKCPVTGEVFLVTGTSPVKVMDGKRYYLDQSVDLSTVSSVIHK